MATNDAQFRFYEELNDFLPFKWRKQDFIYTFQNNPGIKDVIEAIGVPHTEIDLIIVNGASIDFSYPLQNGDRVSVYPKFEALDISTISRVRPKPLREIKFVLDAHLGKLARHLRLLGFDSLFDNHYQDATIAKIALQENRIVLTRDRGLLKNKIIDHGFWLRATQPKQQLMEILKKIDLKSLIKPFTRCLECNGEILSVAKESVLASLPENTNDYYQEFSRCQQCQRIYWQGSHYQKLKMWVDKIIADTK